MYYMYDIIIIIIRLAFAGISLGWYEFGCRHGLCIELDITLLLVLRKFTYPSDAIMNIDNVKEDLEQTNYNFNLSKELEQDRQC